MPSKKTNDTPPKIHDGAVIVEPAAHGVYLAIDLGNKIGLTLTAEDADNLITQLGNARHEFLNAPSSEAK